MSKLGLIPKIAENIKNAETQSDKLDILKRYPNESLLMRILKYAYNPMADFGMAGHQPLHKGKEHGLGISKFMHIFQEILDGKFTHEEAIFATNLAVSYMNNTEVPVFVGVLRKDLDWGLDAETINAVWPDLIQSYPVQTAVVATPELLSKLEYPCVVQHMSNGIRVNIIIRRNTVEFRNKSGEIIHYFDDFKSQFSELAQFGATVFDGHAVLVDEQNNILQVTDEQILSRDTGKLKFMLWDLVRYDGFAQGKDNRLGYNWRYNGIEHMTLLSAEKITDPCFILPTQYAFQSANDAIAFVEKITRPVVIKSLSSTWKGGPNFQELIVCK